MGALILIWVPSIAPAIFGRLERVVNVAIEAAVSATDAGNLMYSFLSSYSPSMTSINASVAVVFPTFIATPAFSNDPPCANR